MLGDRHRAAGLAINNGDGRAPVTLPGDPPVPEAELLRRLAKVVFGQICGDGGLSRAARNTGKGAGVHQDAVLLVGLGEAVGRQLLPRGLNHHLNLLAVFPGELKVPLVVGRHRHDRAGAVAHEHKIGHKDGHVPAGDGVHAVTPGEYPFLGDLLQGPPAFVHGPPVLDEAAHLVFLGGAVGQGQGPGVLRGEAHEGGAPQGVRAGGEHGDGLGLALHRQNGCGPRWTCRSSFSAW